MTAVVFPGDLTLLTPEVVGGALAVDRPDVVVEAVEVLTAKRCGEGVASTADRALLHLTYAPGTAGDLPDRMLLKTMLATPHAPFAMYENEVRFYRELRPGLPIETPAVYASEFDRRSGRFGLLMEDLEQRGVRFPSVLDDVTVDQVRSLLRHLAVLHATWWESPRFADDLAWVGTPLQGGMADVFTTIGLELIEDQVARHPFKADLIAPLGRSVPELWQQLWRVQQRHTEGATTLLHGDPHLGNTYLLPDGTGGLLDWQLMVRGSWAHDVTYLIVTSLTPELRRAHQADLLSDYLDLLGELGVDGVPSYDEALERYRQAALWGLVIGWLICPPDNYGEPITHEAIRRTVEAVRDLDTLAAIERSAW